MPDLPSSPGWSPGIKEAPTQVLQARWLPWRLGWAAVVLFLLFGCFVLAAALPMKLLDPQWHLRIHGAVVNAAGFPLLGLCLLRIAAVLDGEEKRIARRSRLCARLAAPVALGFLLLIPLQFWLLWQSSSTAALRVRGQLAREERNLETLRHAITSASSTADLQRRLQAGAVPQLDATQLDQPLERLRPQLNQLIQQAEQQRTRRSQREGRVPALQIVGTGLRNSLPCLALALGFAALAQRRQSPYPLLIEWQRRLSLPGLRGQGPRGPLRSHPTKAMASYIDEILRPEERDP